MRVILTAGGDGERWGEWGGVPKHLAPVGDGTLIGRLARQFCDHEVMIATRVGGDTRLDIPGTTQHPDVDRSTEDIDKLLSSRRLWSDTDRTLVLFGDVWLTDDAARRIASDPRPWVCFGHAGPSDIKAYNECLGVAFDASEAHEVERVARLLVAARIRGALKRTRLVEWYHAAEWAKTANVTNGRVNPGVHWLEIADGSDDIDKPEEWARHVTARLPRPETVVLIPWRGGIPHRQRLLDYVTAWYRDEVGVEVVVGEDSGDGPFNRSAALNTAAGSLDPAVFFVGDADVFVVPHQFWGAVHAAASSGLLTMAFERYWQLTLPETRRTLDGRVPVERRSRRAITQHVSSALAVPADAWATVGGFDERFVGWGGEDRAFHAAVRTLVGEHDRIDGPAWHLWHEKQPSAVRRDDPQSQANIVLAQRYRCAGGLPGRGGTFLPVIAGDCIPNPDAIRDILTEPGGPLGRVVATGHAGGHTVAV